jgi:hypothetical protein
MRTDSGIERKPPDLNVKIKEATAFDASVRFLI